MSAWMRRSIVIVVMAALAPAAVTHAADDEAKRVTVTAEGFNKEDAVKQALRKALEQGAGQEISSHSKVENFELIRDVIYSRASGVVSEYEILEEKPGPGGTYVVRLSAVVRPSVVAATWGEVQNTLDQLGRPKIMVLVDEYIDGELQAESIVGARIEEMFTKIGFELVSTTGVEELRRREGADANLEGNEAKLQRLAKDAGAHIFIRGVANANRAGIEDLYGVPAAFYNCDVIGKVYWTDNAKLIASESLPATRKGVRSRKEYSPQAARSALAKATLPDDPNERSGPALAARLFASTMDAFATQITAGNEVTLEVEGLDFKNYVNIKRALGELEKLDEVNGEFTKGAGVFRVKTKLAAETLAEMLTEKPFDGMFEIIDLKLNRIQAKAFGH